MYFPYNIWATCYRVTKVSSVDEAQGCNEQSLVNVLSLVKLHQKLFFTGQKWQLFSSASSLPPCDIIHSGFSYF